MPYYAYCVVRLDSNEPWQVFSGIDDRPVFAVRDQKMAVLVTRLERPRLDDARSVVRHGQVIHRAFERRTVLPFRYGTVFASEEQVAQLLHENRDQFTEAIRFLRGKAEMHVKLLLGAAVERPLVMAAVAGQTRAPARGGLEGPGETKAPVALEGAGRARDRFEPDGAGLPPFMPEDTCELQARRLAQRVTETLRPLQEQSCLRLSREGQLLMDLRHLVEEARVEAYQRLSALVPECARDCQVQVTGPWPPYHFLPVAAKLPARSERNCKRSEPLYRRAH